MMQVSIQFLLVIGIMMNVPMLRAAVCLDVGDHSIDADSIHEPDHDAAQRSHDEQLQQEHRSIFERDAQCQRIRILVSCIGVFCFLTFLMLPTALLQNGQNDTAQTNGLRRILNITNGTNVTEAQVREYLRITKR